MDTLGIYLIAAAAFVVGAIYGAYCGYQAAKSLYKPRDTGGQYGAGKAQIGNRTNRQQ